MYGEYWDEKKARKRGKIMYGVGQVIRVLAPGNKARNVISGEPIISRTSFYRSSCGLFMLKCMGHWNGSKLTTKFKQIFRRKLAAILVGSASNDNTEIPSYKK
uniref:Uncharacterized protein n=1 Tax=Oryza meridionalis TaxID=40149 RepID=A0A0E0D133_9ORYZ